MTRPTTPHQSISSPGRASSTSSMSRLRASTVRFSQRKAPSQPPSAHPRAVVTNMLLGLLACDGPLPAIAVWDRLFGKGAWDRDLGQAFSSTTSGSGEKNSEASTPATPASLSPRGAAAPTELHPGASPQHKAGSSKGRWIMGQAGSSAAAPEGKNHLGGSTTEPLALPGSVLQNTDEHNASADLNLSDITDALVSPGTTSLEDGEQDVDQEEATGVIGSREQDAASGTTSASSTFIEQEKQQEGRQVLEDPLVSGSVGEDESMADNANKAQAVKTETAAEASSNKDAAAKSSPVVLQEKKHVTGGVPDQKALSETTNTTTLLDIFPRSSMQWATSRAAQALGRAKEAYGRMRENAEQRRFQNKEKQLQYLELRKKILESHVIPLLELDAPGGAGNSTESPQPAPVQPMGMTTTKIRIRRCLMASIAGVPIEHYFVTFRLPGATADIVVEYNAGGGPEIYSESSETEILWEDDFRFFAAMYHDGFVATGLATGEPETEEDDKSLYTNLVGGSVPKMLSRNYTYWGGMTLRIPDPVPSPMKSLVCFKVLSLFGKNWKKKLDLEETIEEATKEEEEIGKKLESVSKQGLLQSLTRKASLLRQRGAAIARRKLAEIKLQSTTKLLEKTRLGTPKFLRDHNLPGPSNPDPALKNRDPEEEPMPDFEIQAKGFTSLEDVRKLALEVADAIGFDHTNYSALAPGGNNCQTFVNKLLEAFSTQDQKVVNVSVKSRWWTNLTGRSVGNSATEFSNPKNGKTYIEQTLEPKMQQTRFEEQPMLFRLVCSLEKKPQRERTEEDLRKIQSYRDKFIRNFQGLYGKGGAGMDHPRVPHLVHRSLSATSVTGHSETEAAKGKNWLPVLRLSVSEKHLQQMENGIDCSGGK